MANKLHKAGFRPRARVLDLLGEQLIRNHRLALFELVKNAYDADAPDVEVRFEQVNQPDGRIVVLDSGSGMDIDTILNAWLEPGSDHREIQRRRGERSPIFHRLPVGEKGVGRFAVQKLGRKATLVTRRQGGSELVLDIDWEKLTSEHRYLADVPVEIIERKPIEFPGDSHGTLIVIENLKETWTRGDVRNLFRSVNAMVSPFDSHDRFNVNFHLEPNSEWLEGMFEPERAADYALYHFEFTLDDDGFEWHYRFTPYDGLTTEKPIIRPRSEDGEGRESFGFFNLRPPLENESWYASKGRERSVPVSFNDYPVGHIPKGLGIGSIRGRILAFDLDRQIKRFLEATGLPEYLKEQGGMRVYRDGMRVFDYGERGNDWLHLDARRVQVPTRRLSNDQILGEVHLSLDASPKLREKTNREGFVENEAYREFHYAVMCALTAFEAERTKDQKAIRAAFKLTPGDDPKGIDSPDFAINKLREAVLRSNLASELEPYVSRVEDTWREARNTLMSAVGGGLGLSMVFHEIERGVRGLVKGLDSQAEPDTLRRMAHELADMLSDASFLVREGGKEGFFASEMVKWVINITRVRFRYHDIRLVNAFDTLKDRDFPIKGSRRMLVASLSNLVDNAIHWVKVATKKEENRRCVWIGPGSDQDIRAIVVADGGSGFQDAPEEVVQPFFTRREDGMGLGLYYADMAMKAHGGALAFPDAGDVDVPKVCQGAVVALVFKGDKK